MAAQATDLRDKVYAVLGLADPEVYGITVDYRLPVLDVYTRAARALIAKSGRLEILGACANPDRLHGLPSWVPNLIDGWKAEPFPFKVRKAHHEADVVFDDQKNSLRAKGILHGFVGVICDVRVGPDDALEQLHRVYLAWKEFVANAERPENTPGRHTEKDLAGGRNDSAWLDFLSAGSTSSYGMAYGRDGALQTAKPETPYDHLRLSNHLDTRHAEALFVLGGGQPKLNPLFKIYCALGQFGPGRSLGLLENGAVALFPPGVRRGDAVAVLDGAAFPFVLRKHGESGDYTIVGEAREYPLDRRRYLKPSI